MVITTHWRGEEGILKSANISGILTALGFIWLAHPSILASASRWASRLIWVILPAVAFSDADYAMVVKVEMLVGGGKDVNDPDIAPARVKADRKALSRDFSEAIICNDFKTYREPVSA